MMPLSVGRGEPTTKCHRCKLDVYIPSEKIDPLSSEGGFISSKIQSQLDTNVESLIQTQTVLGAVKTGKASKAAQVFEQTQIPKLAEDGTRGDSTLLAEADDLGLGINRPSEGFPEISVH